MATLSASDPRVNTSNLPTYSWPKASLPSLKYPYAHYQQENDDNEAEALNNVRAIIENSRAENKDIAAMIVEPITAFENRSATPLFYKRLRKLSKEMGVVFIVDETRTGMGITGKIWAQEHWYLNERDGGHADIVTFGGRAGISGFYASRDI